MNSLNPDHDASQEELEEKFGSAPPSFEESVQEPEFQSMSVDIHEDGSVKTITVFVKYLDVDYETDIGVRFNVEDGVACHQTKVVTQLTSEMNEVYAIMKAEDHLRHIIDEFPSSVNNVERLEDALHARLDVMRMEMGDADYI